jgi:hypothetical protein
VLWAQWRCASKTKRSRRKTMAIWMSTQTRFKFQYDISRFRKANRKYDSSDHPYAINVIYAKG